MIGNQGKSKTSKISTGSVRLLIWLGSLSGKQKQLISVSILIMLAILSSVLYPRCKSSFQDDEQAIEIIKSRSDEIKKAVNICVYVCGKVVSTGVYMLEDGARVIDAINIAGGATDEANLRAINLAQELSDGMMINVPDENSPDITCSQMMVQPGNKLDINTANAQQFQELPGIGPSLAERIIKYRQENGEFSSVDELLNVSGIGEKKLEGIRELVDV